MGCRSKALVRSRVEPKTFFANERTFLAWLNISALIMLTGLSLLGGTFSSLSGSSACSVATPSRSESPASASQAAIAPSVSNTFNCRASQVWLHLDWPAFLIWNNLWELVQSLNLRMLANKFLCYKESYNSYKSSGEDLAFGSMQFMNQSSNFWHYETLLKFMWCSMLGWLSHLWQCSSWSTPFTCTKCGRFKSCSSAKVCALMIKGGPSCWSSFW